MTRIFYVGLGLLSLLTTILYCGIARNREFNEPSIFVKYRPTTKIHFYSPIGESDMTLPYLSEEKKKEELLYTEFVEDQKIYTDNLNRLSFLPYVLIQLTLTFLCLGLRIQRGIRLMWAALHFLINLLPTTLMVTLMLFYEESWQLLGLTTIVLIMNVWTARRLQRKQKPAIQSTSH